MSEEIEDGEKIEEPKFIALDNLSFAMSMVEDHIKANNGYETEREKNLSKRIIEEFVVITYAMTGLSRNIDNSFIEVFDKTDFIPKDEYRSLLDSAFETAVKLRSSDKMDGDFEIYFDRIKRVPVVEGQPGSKFIEGENALIQNGNNADINVGDVKMTEQTQLNDVATTPSDKIEIITDENRDLVHEYGLVEEEGSILLSCSVLGAAAAAAGGVAAQFQTEFSLVNTAVTLASAGTSYILAGYVEGKFGRTLWSQSAVVAGGAVIGYGVTLGVDYALRSLGEGAEEYILEQLPPAAEIPL